MSIRSALLAVCLMLTSSADSFAAIAQVQAPVANPNKPPDAAVAAGAVGFFVCIGIFVVALIGAHIWAVVFTLKDAKRRGMDPTPWIILEIFVGLFVLIIYLCVREPLLSERHRRDWEEDDDEYEEDRPRRRQRRPRDDDEDEHDRYHS